MLAEALYAGADWAFALRDALLEVGATAMAVHFQTVKLQGCWAVDSIMGRGGRVQGT
jgi:hypothetical protein